MRCSPVPLPAPVRGALRRAAVRTVTRAAAVGAALAALAPFTPTAAAQSRAAALDDRPTVAVMYFNNGSLLRHADFEPLSKGVADMLITDLARNDRVRVVERDQLQKVLDEVALNTTDRVDRETAVRVGKLLGAQHMVFGGFVIDPRGRMRLDARAVRVETGEIEHVETAERKSDDVLELIDDLGRKLNAGMRLPPMPRSQASQAPDAAGSDTPATVDTGPRARESGNRFQALMLYSRALAEEDGGRKPQAVALYRSALAQYPGYDAARVRLRRLAQRS